MTDAIRVDAQDLTAEAFAPFGFVIELPSDGRRTGPHSVFADNRPDAKVTTTLIHLEPSLHPRSVIDVERHLHSVQLFLPLSNGRLSVVVFPSDAADRPDAAGARAFLASPGQAFGYHPGTWHAGVAAADAPVSVASLLSRNGTASDVVEAKLDRAVEIEWR
jgi:ureidoglycolate lyase